MKDFFVFDDYYYFLFLVIPLALVLVIVYIKGRDAVSAWFNPSDIRLSFPQLRLIFRVLGMILLIVGLLSPFWGRIEQSISKMGRQVFILLDVSASMNTEDLKPSRLEKVKKELKSVTAELRGDKTGLILFTTDAYVACPLTFDNRIVMRHIDMVTPDQFSNTGTEFRAPLHKALERFTNAPKNSKVSRAVILISDGEDFGDNYTSVTNRLQDEGVKVYPVGIGTFEGGKVPDIRNGKRRGYKRNKDGSQAISTLKEESLQLIADEFGTKYHRISDQLSDLSPVLNQIKLQSSSVLNRETELASVNRYQYFLLPGFLLLALSMFWLPFKPRIPTQKESS